MGKQLLEQYQNTIKNGAIFDFSARGKIEVSGKDRTSFLHRMLTNDIEHLAAGEGCYTCFLTNQAKVITDMNVFALEKTIWLEVEPGFSENTIKALSQFTLMDEVTFKDKTNDLATLLLFGPKARVFLQMLTKSSGYPDKHFQHACSKIKDIGCHIFCIPIFGNRGWSMVTPKENFDAFRKMIYDSAASFDMKPTDDELAEILRIESGAPRFGVDFDDKTIVMEVGIDAHAISFDKGCYPGQELVARMDSRAKFAKKLTSLMIESEIPPKPNDLIQKDGKQIGRITSAIFSPKFKKSIALGFVIRDHLASGHQVEVISGGKSLNAELRM